MEVGSPEWIEASVDRLDDLERQHQACEEAIEAAHDPLTLAEHTATLNRLDGEIKSLFAQLEDVAGEDEEGEEEAEGDEVAAAAPLVTQGDDELSTPHIAASVEVAASVESPVAEALAAPAEKPFDDRPSPSTVVSPAAAASPGGFDAPAPAAYDDSDLKPQGGGAKWVFVGIVLLAAAGIGGFFFWQDMQAKKAANKKGPATPETVIKAAEVPDDTESPNAVKGGDATISPNANPTVEVGKKKKKKEEKTTKPIELKGDGGPL